MKVNIVKELKEENQVLKRFCSLYEQAAIERDRYKSLILKAFNAANCWSKKGAIYKIKLTNFEKENNINLSNPQL